MVAYFTGSSGFFTGAVAYFKGASIKTKNLNMLKMEKAKILMALF
jgi:hypothetical protein